MMRSMRLLAVVAAVLGLSLSAWAQAQPEKKAAETVTGETKKKASAKKKAAEEVVVEKKAEVTEKKTAVKKMKKSETAEEPAKEVAAKKAAPAEKKAEVTEKKTAVKKMNKSETAEEPAKEVAAKKAAPAEKNAAVKAGAPYAGGIVNLNTATQSQLEALPGVGEANASHIIKGRPYKSAEELLTRKIVQERYYNSFKAYVAVK